MIRHNEFDYWLTTKDGDRISPIITANAWQISKTLVASLDKSQVDVSEAIKKVVHALELADQSNGESLVDIVIFDSAEVNVLLSARVHFRPLNESQISKQLMESVRSIY